MLIIQDFRFLTNVSVEGYQSKNEAKACLSARGAKAIGREKMAFIEKNLNVTEFLQYAMRGHAFCNLFKIDPNREYWVPDSKGQHHKQRPVYSKGKNKGAMKLCFKSDKYFRGAQTVFVDIDYTRFTDVQEYLGILTYPPTCVYMSFSDKKEKNGRFSRRFRMVYVFDKVLNEKEFLHVAKVINDQIVLDTAEPMDDDCGTRKSQYMNGVFANDETYVSHFIYDVHDFPKKSPSQNVNVQTQTQTPVDTSTSQEIVFNEKMLKDMQNMDYDVFMHYYSWQHQYKYRIEYGDIWIDGLYQLTDENYLQLWWYRERQVDGQHRRRKLYKNACLRRLMFPDMTPDTALFNLYVDFVRFFDNSDGVITLDTLIRKVRHAFEKSPEQLVEYCKYEIEYWRKNRPQYITRPGVQTSWGMNNTIKSHIRYAEIDAVYDRSMSLQENIAAGIGVPETTLYRYCKDRGINTNPNRQMTEAERRAAAKQEKQNKIALFQHLYDPSKTTRANKELLAQHGVNLSVGSIVEWSKKYCSTPQPIQDTPPTINFPPIHYDVPNFILQSAKIIEDAEAPTEKECPYENFTLNWQPPKFLPW